MIALGIDLFGEPVTFDEMWGKLIWICVSNKSHQSNVNKEQINPSCPTHPSFFLKNIAMNLNCRCSNYQYFCLIINTFWKYFLTLYCPNCFLESFLDSTTVIWYYWWENGCKGLKVLHSNQCKYLFIVDLLLGTFFFIYVKLFAFFQTICTFLHV